MLVLCAVFVPTLFLNGLSGAFYHQFAVTISAATVISLLLSLTLSPALAAMLLQPHQRGAGRATACRHCSSRVPATASTAASSGSAWPMRALTAPAGADAEADDGRLCRPDRARPSGVFASTPTGFIPAQDQGYFLTVIQLPPGSSLERTDAVMRKVAARILPIPGVKGSVMLAGFDGASQTLAPNAAAAYVPLQVVRGAQEARRDARQHHGRGAASAPPTSTRRG